MNYSCEEEYNDAMSGQAQAEYEQQEAYYSFLNNLIENKQYQLHGIYVALDILNEANNKEFNLFRVYLLDIKSRLEMPKLTEPLTETDIKNLPF